MFLYFFCTFVISILILSCQSTISLLFIIHLEFWAWFSIINTSKEPKGRFGPFSHFWPLSQKRPRHFGDSTGESSNWNKRSHVFEDAKLARMFLTLTYRSKRNRIMLCRARRAWWSGAEKVLSLALWVAGGAPNHMTKSLQPPEAIQEVKDGGRTNFLIQGKIFLPLVYIIF